MIHDADKHARLARPTVPLGDLDRALHQCRHFLFNLHKGQNAVRPGSERGQTDDADRLKALIRIRFKGRRCTTDQGLCP
jgi:hypothetical protein